MSAKSTQLTLLTIGIALSFVLLEIIRPGIITPTIGFVIIAAVGALMLRLKPDPGIKTESVTPPLSVTGSQEQTAERLSRAIESISHVTTQQTGQTKEQVDLINHASSFLTGLIDSSKQMQEQTRLLTASARQSSEHSESSNTTIREVISGMTGIRERVATTAETVRRLSSFARRIDDIIGSVSEIATQSNLLALNASIEAARAGVHGRGFAVVAEEVRSLSQQSTQSARQVRVILEEIQSTMKQAIEATEAGLQEVDASLATTAQAETAMSQLGANVTSAQTVINRVNEIVRQQIEGLDEITIHIERLERVSRHNLSNTQEVETIVEELSRLAADLECIIVPSPGVNQYAQDYAEQYT